MSQSWTTQKLLTNNHMQHDEAEQLQQPSSGLGNYDNQIGLDDGSATTGAIDIFPLVVRSARLDIQAITATQLGMSGNKVQSPQPLPANLEAYVITLGQIDEASLIAEVMNSTEVVKSVLFTELLLDEPQTRKILLAELRERAKSHDQICQSINQLLVLSSYDELVSGLFTQFGASPDSDYRSHLIAAIKIVTLAANHPELWRQLEATLPVVPFSLSIILRRIHPSLHDNNSKPWFEQSLNFICEWANQK